MTSLAKLSTYAAWIAIALAAAAARPASADLFDRAGNGDSTTITGSFDSHRTTPGRSGTFNEATSFADSEELPVPTESEVGQPDEERTQTSPSRTAIAEAELLVGTWAWEGMLEGMPAYIATAFYPDGTYESYAETPVLDLYEVGMWALVDGMLTTQVVDYAPRVIQTPYGPQAVPMVPEYRTAVAFLDEDTVETEIGLSYRID